MQLPRIRLTREKALTATPDFVEALHARRIRPYPGLGGTNLDLQRINSVFVQAQAASYAYMYETQPAVRAVVDYIARNVAQLGLKLYRRVSDDEREHAGDHPAAVSLRKPNPQTPGQKFVFNLIADFLIYDNAYALKFRSPSGGPLVMLNVPPHAVGIIGQRFYAADAYRIWQADGTWFDVLPEDILHWGGYNPEDPRAGLSKLETLRNELAADAAARVAKEELDKSGGMPKGWMERPLEAEWSGDERERFQAQWGNWAKTPTRGIPVAEDGMVFKQATVSPEDAQMLQSREFARREVASEYGLCNVPPESEEERRQVYADVLPPYCEMLCAYLDLHILQNEFFEDAMYFSFNLEEKQRSDDRLRTLLSLAGAPFMLRDEVRAIADLAPLPGGVGKHIIVPRNVQEEDGSSTGKPSIDTMPVQDPNKPSQDGDHRVEEPKALIKRLEVSTIPRVQGDVDRQARYTDEAAGMLEEYYSRIARSVLDAKSKGKAVTFDLQRWDRELGGDLHRFVRSLVEREGGLYVSRLLGDDFDMRRVENYLKQMAYGTAQGINRATKRDMSELGVEDALASARGERAEVAAASIGTRATVFARIEAGKQAPHSELRQKTWVANTDRHASLNGATVPLDASFGAIEPGSEPGCKCTAIIA